MSFNESSVVRHVRRMFPTPDFLTLPAAGVDVSDTSIKWVSLDRSNHQVVVRSYGEVPVPEGAVENGVVKDIESLSRALRELKGKMRPIEYVHVSLPEESVYVFSMQVPRGSNREQIKTMIEFEFENRIPLPLGESVYDFDIGNEGDTSGELEIIVTAFPRDLATRYAQAFDQAGLRVLSFENELLSTSSALISENDHTKGTLIIDFGASRTGIACTRGRIPIFTATIPIGSRRMTEALVGVLGVSDIEAVSYLDVKGLSEVGSPAYRAIGPISDMLATQVERYFRLWGFNKDSTETFITRGIMVGGGSNVFGLTERIAQSIRVPVEKGNVWGRFVASFDDYIPPIEYDISLEYATAIGLAIRTIVI